MTFWNRITGRGRIDSVDRVDPPVTASAGGVEGVRADQNDTWLNVGFGGRSRVATLPQVSPDIAQRHATVFACCNVVAGDLSKVPLLVHEKRGGRLVRVDDHPLNALLNVESGHGVPAWVTRFCLNYGFLLRGQSSSYAPRTGRGDVEFIEYIHADSVSMLRNGRERFFDIQDGAEDFRRVPSRSMVHLRYLALDGWTGRSPLSVAFESVGLALAGQEAAAKSASGTHIQGYIKLEDNFENDEARQRSEKAIGNALRNPEVAGWPAIGQNDEIKTLDLTAADQELLASRKFDREQLAAIYRVPPSKLQMLEYGVKANGQQQAIDYKTDCLTHWGNPVQQCMEMGLLTAQERESGLCLVHNYDALMEATTKERFDAYRSAVGGPWMPAYVAQDAEGIPRTSGSEKLYPPSNMSSGQEGENKTGTDDADPADGGADEGENDE